MGGVANCLPVRIFERVYMVVNGGRQEDAH